MGSFYSPLSPNPRTWERISIVLTLFLALMLMACGSLWNWRIWRKCKGVFDEKKKEHLRWEGQQVEMVEEQAGGRGGFAGLCWMSGMTCNDSESPWLRPWIWPERPAGTMVSFWEIKWCYQNFTVNAASGYKATISGTIPMFWARSPGLRGRRPWHGRLTPHSIAHANTVLMPEKKKIKGQQEASGRSGRSASRFWNSRYAQFTVFSQDLVTHAGQDLILQFPFF